MARITAAIGLLAMTLVAGGCAFRGAKSFTVRHAAAFIFDTATSESEVGFPLLPPRTLAHLHRPAIRPDPACVLRCRLRTPQAVPRKTQSSPRRIAGVKLLVSFEVVFPLSSHPDPA